MKTNRWVDNLLLLLACIVAFIAARMVDNAGMPQKWHAAILGILLPFFAVVSIKRTSWSRPTFWTTLVACFAANFLLICIFFGVVLWDVTTFGWIWWVPVAFVETLFLLHFQPKLERKLRAR